LPDGVCSLNGNQYVTVLIPQVPPYSLAQGEAFVLVTTKVEPGNYSLAYKEQYTDPLGGVHSNMYYNATVYVVPSQPLRLEVSPVTAVSGGVATLIAKAKGRGMITALNLVSPFSIIASNFTPNFPVNGDAVFAFKLLIPASDGPGIYPITINLNYLSYESDYQATYNSFIYLVPVYVIQGTNAIEVTVEPSVLYYQTPNSVVLSLTNTLNETLRNVSITITTPSTAVQISPQNAYLSSLKPKSTASLNITVLTDLNTVQAVPVTLTVSYLSNEGLQVETIPLVLTFTGLIKLELLSPNLTYNNGSVMFSGTLLNVGNTQANNVIVYYPGGSLYLGQLPPNSPLNFEIPAQWNGKTASVNFIVSYETPLYTVVNMSYSYSYNLTIANSSTTHHTYGPNLFLSVYFYVLIVLIVLIIVLIIIRKRRRSNG
jgi:hypothetical protein